MRIKALSVRQPWANLIAKGEKSIETRKWATDYRGPLVIASCKKPAIAPAGYAVAIAQLVECRPMRRSDEAAAKCPVYSGAFAWVLADVKRLTPFPVRGQLGLYDVEVPDDVLSEM